MNTAQPPTSRLVPGRDRIFLFPLSLDDELHVSQAGRYHMDSGNGSTRKSFEQLYDASPFRYTHWIPQHLERFARKLPGSVMENTEALLRANTLFPLFETFGNATLSLTADASPLTEQIYNMPKRINGESGKIHLCIDCLHEDWEEQDARYIHRSHQIPGVEVCWKHASRLLSCCPFCGCPFEQTDKADLILAPWKPCCICGTYLPDAAFWEPSRDATEVELDFARFTHELLITPTQHLSAGTLTAAYKKQITELGLMRGSNIDRKALVAALEEFFGSNFLAKIDAAYRTGPSQHWLRLCAASSTFDVPLTRHLAVAHFLFRKANLFWKAASAAQNKQAAKISTEDTPTTKEPNRKTSVLLSPLRYDLPEDNAAFFSPEKLLISELLRQHTEWAIEDLWREHPALMRKLLRNNNESLMWLQEQLNTSRNDALSSDSRDQSEDLRWAEEFKNAATAEYLSTMQPTKATCSHLMRKAGWKGPQKPSADKYPLARKALESLAESRWHYYARRILWAKLTIGMAPTARSSVVGLSGIEYHRGWDLLGLFSEVAADRPLETGTLMEILLEYRIPCDWAGLPPSPKYYATGAKYVPRRNAFPTAP